MMWQTFEQLESQIQFDCNALHLPQKIADEAVSLLKKYVEKKKTLQGKCVEHYSPALIWLACRKWDYPMTAKKINDIIDLDTVNTKGELVIPRIGKEIAREIEERVVPITLEKYVEMIQAKLHSPPTAITRAYFLIDYMRNNNVVIGYNNPGMASAIAYIADRIEGHREIEKAYVKAVGTTEITLRTYKRKMLQAIPSLKQRGTKYVWKDSYTLKMSDCQDVQDDWWKSVTEMVYDKKSKV